MMMRGIFSVLTAIILCAAAGAAQGEVQAEFTNSSCDVVNAETIRVRNISKLVVDGGSVPGEFWVDFRWSPQSLGFSPILGGVETSSIGDDMPAASVTNISCSITRSTTGDKCAITLAVTGRVCGPEAAIFETAAPFVPYINALRPPGCDTWRNNGPDICYRTRGPYDPACTHWTLGGNDSFGTANSECTDAGLHKWCADNDIPCTVTVTVKEAFGTFLASQTMSVKCQ